METDCGQLSCAFLKWCMILQALLIAFLLTFFQDLLIALSTSWQGVHGRGLPVLGLSFTLPVGKVCYSISSVCFGGGSFLNHC